MSESIPSTSEVRESYQSSGDGLDFKRRFNERGEDFDRWLESVKREAAAVALEDVVGHIQHDERLDLTNQAHSISVIRNRAAEYRTTRTPGEGTT